MYRWFVPFTCGIVLLCHAARITSAELKEGPVYIVRTLLADVSTIKSAEDGSLSKANVARNAYMAEKVNGLLDLPVASQRILGRHWKKLTPVQQQEFIVLFTEFMVKVAYPKSALYFDEFTVKVTDENIKEELAEVKTMITHEVEGPISVDYRMQKHNGTWRVRDVILDDVSLIRNLQSQCSKIITEHSYNELVRRMREKLTE